MPLLLGMNALLHRHKQPDRLCSILVVDLPLNLLHLLYNFRTTIGMGLVSLQERVPFFFQIGFNPLHPFKRGLIVREVLLGAGDMSKYKAICRTGDVSGRGIFGLGVIYKPWWKRVSMFWGSRKPFIKRRFLSDLNPESQRSMYILPEIGDMAGFPSLSIAPQWYIRSMNCFLGFLDEKVGRIKAKSYHQLRTARGNRRPSNVSRAFSLRRSDWRALPRKQYTFANENDLLVVYLKI